MYDPRETLLSFVTGADEIDELARCTLRPLRVGALMKEATAPKRLALIDRDGTIIVDKVYLSDPDEIEFAPGAIEGLQLLRNAGFTLVLITNQSGIARGSRDLATLGRIHDRLQSMLAVNELRLEAIYFCPHGPDDGCDCRKPAPGWS